MNRRMTMVWFATAAMTAPTGLSRVQAEPPPAKYEATWESLDPLYKQDIHFATKE